MMIRRPLPPTVGPRRPLLPPDVVGEPKLPVLPPDVIGRPILPKPDAATRLVFKSKDANHDGKLDLQEFLGSLAGKTAREVIGMVKRFMAADKNHDGVLSVEEFGTTRKHQPLPPRAIVPAGGGGTGHVEMM